MLEGRIVGLDVGDVRIGVAVSDPLGIVAQPYSVIKCSSPDADVEAIRAVVEEKEAVKIVVGLPLNMEGEPGPQAEKVLAFAEKLRDALGIEIVTQDERYSTAAAERMLIDANVRRKDRKKVIDKIAATHILQVYMDRVAHAKKRAELNGE